MQVPKYLIECCLNSVALLSYLDSQKWKSNLSIESLQELSVYKDLLDRAKQVSHWKGENIYNLLCAYGGTVYFGIKCSVLW